MNSSIRESAIESAVNEVLQELINSEEKAERLVSNTKYMLWLEEFTAKNHGFSDYSWLQQLTPKMSTIYVPFLMELQNTQIITFCLCILKMHMNLMCTFNSMALVMKSV